MSEALAGSRVQKCSKEFEARPQHRSTKYTTTTVLQLPCTCGLQSAQQVVEETFFSKRGPPLLEIMETSLQKPSCVTLVNVFQTEGHLAVCHLVAYGRTATAC